MKTQTVILLTFICLQMMPNFVQGHGRFVKPPSRASMWRFGFSNPPDYNDNEGFCGGLSKMIQLGGCGICGDALDLSSPKPHEAGGKYGNGIIVKNYNEGEVISVTVQITANHKGYFTFKICANNNVLRDPEQSCFDGNVLKVYPSMSETYVLPDQIARDYTLQLKLPSGMTCSQCIIQWTYTAGNNWGVCEDGSQGLGCGTQEVFRACSDVSITSGTGPIKPKTTMPPRTTPNTTKESVITKTTSSSKKPHVKNCVAVGIWSSISGMNDWCKSVCTAPKPFCPASHCICE